MTRMFKNIMIISLILLLYVVLILVVRNIYYASNIEDVTSTYIEDKGKISGDIALNDIVDESINEPIMTEETELSTAPEYNTSNIVLIVILSLVISILVIYLILSKFNLLSMKDIFKTKKKTLVSIMGIILLTSMISLESIYIPYIYYTNNSSHYITSK